VYVFTDEISAYSKQDILNKLHCCALDLPGVVCWDAEGKLTPDYLGMPPFGLNERLLVTGGQKFLRDLSKHLYSFDQSYLAQVADLMGRQADPNRATALAFELLMPQLQNLGYPSIQKTAVDPALASIRTAISRFDLKPGHRTEQDARLAIEMLAASLKTAESVMTTGQRTAAERLRAKLADALTDPARKSAPLSTKMAGDLRALLTDLSHTPYLAGRTASGLAMVRYLSTSN
jgi:hypothetical protein